MLATAKGGDEVTLLLTAAIEQANKHPAGKGGAWDHLDSIRFLGTGDTAAEALAIAVYCINAVDDPFEAVVVAANHDGRRRRHGQTDGRYAVCNRRKKRSIKDRNHNKSKVKGNF